MVRQPLPDAVMGGRAAHQGVGAPHALFARDVLWDAGDNMVYSVPRGGVSLPRIACWQEMLWWYEGDIDGLDPDWSAFCAQQAAHASGAAVVRPAA